MINELESLALSVFLATIFVLSLYLWRYDILLDKDNPKVIKRRLISVSVVCVLSCVLLQFFVDFEPDNPDSPDLVDRESAGYLQREEVLWKVGLRWNGLGYATCFPLLIMMTLYLGPLFACLLHEDAIETMWGRSKSFIREHPWLFWRNIIWAPLFEEFVFRACVCTLLISGGWSFGFTMVGSPLLFGLAHMHHLINHVRARGMSVGNGTLLVLFQLFYTTLFGSIVSYFYLRTGHVMACFLPHAFCNTMGFPNLSFVHASHPLYPKRWAIGFMYVVGIFLFFYFVDDVTEPSLYTCCTWNTNL